MENETSSLTDQEIAAYIAERASALNAKSKSESQERHQGSTATDRLERAAEQFSPPS